MLQLQSCLVTGSAPRTAVIWAARTTASTSGRPTSQKKSIHSERRLRLQRCGFTGGTSSLRSAVPGCWRPLLTLGCRSKSASSGPTTVSSRSTRSGTLGLRFRWFVYFETVDVLSFKRQWAWSILLSVVLVGFIHGRNRSRSHRHDFWSNFVANTPNAENLLRVQRQVEALKLCCRPRRQSSNHGSHGIESHQLETSCDLRRLLREGRWA